MIRILGVKLNFGIFVNIVINPTTLFKIVFANNANVQKETIFYSGSKSPREPFNQNFKAYQNQIHPNELPSFHPVQC